MILLFEFSFSVLVVGSYNLDPTSENLASCAGYNPGYTNVNLTCILLFQKLPKVNILLAGVISYTFD